MFSVTSLKTPVQNTIYLTYNFSLPKKMQSPMSPAGQQSQLNSPTVQLDIDQIKFYQQNQQQHQPATSLTSPTDIVPNEQPAATAPAKMSPLTTLKQELAKLHQKRFTVAAVPLTPPLQAASANGTPLSYSEAVKSTVPDQPIQAAATQQSVTATVPAVDGSLTTPAPLNRKISRFQVNVVPEVQPAPVQQHTTPSPPLEVGHAVMTAPVPQQTHVLNTMEHSGLPQQLPATHNGAASVVGTVHHDDAAAGNWNLNQYPVTYTSNVSPTPQTQG